MLTNVIFCRENVELMRELPDETIDLIHIDPPFLGNQQYEVMLEDLRRRRLAPTARLPRFARNDEVPSLCSGGLHVLPLWGTDARPPRGDLGSSHLPKSQASSLKSPTLLRSCSHALMRTTHNYLEGDLE